VGILARCGVALSLALILPAQAVEPPSRERGVVVFQTYCMKCHGIYGDGKGKMAPKYNPPPANLKASVLSDTEKEKIIRQGGAGVGRSPNMPPWGQELTDQQIQDVIAHLRAIKK
jgi:mono/diheme cytochrome c family protein